MNMARSALVAIFLFALIGTAFSWDFIGDPITKAACKLVSCGHGQCVKSNQNFPPVHCECNQGWKELQIGDVTIPTCVPDCNMDFSCGGDDMEAPPKQHIIDITDPCNLAWCGAGTCERDGWIHACRCHDGADNLMGNSALPCYKKCSFGADCLGYGVTTGNGTTNSTPTSATSSTPETSSTPSVDSTSSTSQVSTSVLMVVATAFISML